MEGRVNYLLVGVFVTLFITGILSFAFWLTKYSDYEQQDHYLIYFDESVAGLNKDSSVKYMGVDVGVIEDIKVHPENTQLIAVYLKIKHDIKIKEDMQATLKFYGMTGLAYVEIFGHDPNAPLLLAKDGEIPLIKSSPSLFVKLDEILASMTEKLSLTLEKIDMLISPKNLKHLENSLENISAITGELNSNKANITQLVQRAILLEDKATLSLEKINEITSHLDAKLGDDIKQTLREFKAASRAMKIVTKRIDKSIKNGDYNLKEISEPMVQKLAIMIDEFNALSIKMQEAVEKIEESPSDILFKSKAIKLGPGE